MGFVAIAISEMRGGELGGGMKMETLGMQAMMQGLSADYTYTERWGRVNNSQQERRGMHKMRG